MSLVHNPYSWGGPCVVMVEREGSSQSTDEPEAPCTLQVQHVPAERCWSVLWDAVFRPQCISLELNTPPKVSVPMHRGTLHLGLCWPTALDESVLDLISGFFRKPSKTRRALSLKVACPGLCTEAVAACLMRGILMRSLGWTPRDYDVTLYRTLPSLRSVATFLYGLPIRGVRSLTLSLYDVVLTDTDATHTFWMAWNRDVQLDTTVGPFVLVW